jgi:hypothetical protein
MAFSDYLSSGFSVTGKSVEDILSLNPDDFVYMDESDVRKIVGRLVSAGNKRLRAFERKGDYSPAYNRAMESGGKFSTAGKDFDQLQEEFARAREFFQSPTGSLKEWSKQKKYMEKIQVSTPDAGDTGLPEEPLNPNLRWEIFEKLRKHDPKFSAKVMKYRAIETIEEQISSYESEGLDPRLLKEDYYISRLQRDLMQEYEREAELNESFDAAVSEFFDT